MVIFGFTYLGILDKLPKLRYVFCDPITSMGTSEIKLRITRSERRYIFIYTLLYREVGDKNRAVHGNNEEASNDFT